MSLLVKQGSAAQALINSKVRMYTREMAKAVRNANKATIQAIVDVVAKRAKERVPVVSGRLRDSIRGRVRKARGEDRLTGSVSTNTKGMPKYLYGTRNTKADSKRLKKISSKLILQYGYGLDVEVGRAGRKYKSTPYLRPAMLESAETMQRILSGELQIEAKKAGVPKARRGRPRKEQ